MTRERRRRAVASWNPLRQLWRSPSHRWFGHTKQTRRHPSTYVPGYAQIQKNIQDNVGAYYERVRQRRAISGISPQQLMLMSRSQRRQHTNPHGYRKPYHKPTRSHGGD